MRSLPLPYARGSVGFMPYKENVLQGTAIRFNSQIPAEKMEEYCALGTEEEAYMELVFEQLALTARTYHKLLRVARTIADMEGSEKDHGQPFAGGGLLSWNSKELLGEWDMKYKYWWMCLQGLSNRTKRNLLERYKSAHAIYDLSEKCLRQDGLLDARQADIFFKGKEKAILTRHIRHFTDRGIFCDT